MYLHLKQDTAVVQAGEAMHHIFTFITGQPDLAVGSS